ncbi:hypothetical protein [Clostridium beijerinckii]|uniref:hypothetical protein n=1 Tax=Clostridium beijerinckii TaxID=1520 RepID=UPI0022E353A5|nr:hypothetical protein [Clostridium beijerinckii]
MNYTSKEASEITGSFIASPSDAVYSATKSFILSFTNALAAELRGTGVKALLRI